MKTGIKDAITFGLMLRIQPWRLYEPWGGYPVKGMAMARSYFVKTARGYRAMFSLKVTGWSEFDVDEFTIIFLIDTNNK